MDEETGVSDSSFGVDDFMKEAAESPDAAAVVDSTPPPHLDQQPVPDAGEEPESTQAPNPSPTPQPTQAATPPAPMSRAEIIKNYPPDVQHVFKNMNNAAFNMLEPIYRKSLEAPQLPPDVAELQKKIAEAEKQRYYEHPDAWQLAPEVVEMRKEVSNADFEGRYWRNQLAAVRSGKPFQQLYYDEKTGQYTQGEPEELDDATKIEKEADCIANMQLAQNLKLQAQGKMNAFAKEFKGGYESFNTQLGKFKQDIFGGVDFSKGKLGEIYNKTLSTFPKHMHGRTEIQLLAMGATAIEALIAENTRLKAVNGTKQNVQNTRRANGPGAGGAGGGGRSTNNDDAFAAFTRLGG